jgi:hypothetical protein
MAQIEKNRRPDCKVRSIGWGPWDGGMVHDGLRKLFHEEGVDLIPLQQGAKLFLETMETAGSPVCIILASLDPEESSLERFCDFPQPHLTTPHEVEKKPIPAEPTVVEQGASIGISTERIPPLRHHILGGRAVVPAALLLEWCATAVVHRHPGLDLHGIDHFSVLKGVILDGNQDQRVSLFTGVPTTEEQLLRIPVEIRSDLHPERIHARAEVLLGQKSNTRSNLIAPTYTEDDDPRYNEKLFHGSTFRCIQKVSEISTDGIAYRADGADAPSFWFQSPLRNTWLLDPLRIDAVFQALILWSRKQRNTPCLPCAIDQLRCHQKLDPGVLETRIHIVETEGAIARARVEILNRSGLPALTMEGASVIIDASLESAFQQDRLPEEASS